MSDWNPAMVAVVALAGLWWGPEFAIFWMLLALNPADGTRVLQAAVPIIEMIERKRPAMGEWALHIGNAKLLD